MMRAAALSSHPFAEEISAQVAASGGSALKAALGGYFALAGVEPGVLFSPLSILVGGIGSGVRAFDGRARQPGLLGKRPRGFVAGEEVPVSARVAMPGSIAAASLACAYHSGTSLLSCVRLGEAEAKKLKASGRQELLSQIAGRGALALSEGALRRSLLASFGAAAQGNLTLADLTSTPSLDCLPLEEPDEFRVPWEAEKPETAFNPGVPHCSIAVDSSGLFAAISFYRLPDEAFLEDYEVALPAFAQPVLRGVVRPVPGRTIAAPCNLRFLRGTGGELIGAEASPTGGALAQESSLALFRDPSTKEVTVRKQGRISIEGAEG